MVQRTVGSLSNCEARIECPVKADPFYVPSITFIWTSVPRNGDFGHGHEDDGRLLLLRRAYVQSELRVLSKRPSGYAGSLAQGVFDSKKLPRQDSRSNAWRK